MSHRKNEVTHKLAYARAEKRQFIKMIQL